MKIMRKLNYFLGLSVMSVAMLFTSCGPDEDAKGPGINLTSDAEVTTAPNTSITIAWDAYAGDANLDFFTITEGNTPITGWDEYEIPSAQNENFSSTASVLIGEDNTTFTLTVTDKDGLTASKTVTVTVEAALAVKGTKQLGAGGNLTLGSYYSVSTNTVYGITDAKTNYNILDMVFTSTASAAKFISPKNAASADINKSNRVTNYQKVTAIDFEDASASDLDAITPSADNITVVQNDIVVFKTQDNVKGIFKVNSLTVAADGSVTIDIKVKQ